VSHACWHRGKRPEFANVRVNYATDRFQSTTGSGLACYTNSRGKLSWGYCDVSIPSTHKLGEVESPSVWRLQFRAVPSKHVVVLSTVARTKQEFFSDLAQQFESSGRNAVLFFVHGYNVTFEDAARRTAQIVYDLKFQGAAIFYSWPSRGAMHAYTVDEQNAEWSQGNLTPFLREFFATCNAESIFLVAHSMGNRALMRALVTLIAESPSIRGRLTEIVLAAPDIDADVFARDIVPAFSSSGAPLTLYASSTDRALAASRRFHGAFRAGDSGHELLVLQGMETVDASNVNTELLGHSYYSGRSVLSDMHSLIQHGTRASARFGLRPVNTAKGCHWEFEP
jgi:esterase/lipase superfamily enzyme